MPSSVDMSDISGTTVEFDSNEDFRSLLTASIVFVVVVVIKSVTSNRA